MKKINILESISELDLKSVEYGQFYFRNELISLKIFLNLIIVTKLENSQKPGETCDCLKIHFPDATYDNPIRLDILKKVVNLNYFLVEAMRRPEIITELGYESSSYVVKAIHVFSPFASHKKIKNPKKWTPRHFIKGVLSGQIKNGYSHGTQLDDTGEKQGIGVIDPLIICKEVIENSGWRIYEDKGKLNVYTSYNSNEFVFTE